MALLQEYRIKGIAPVQSPFEEIALDVENICGVFALDSCGYIAKHYDSLDDYASDLGVPFPDQLDCEF